MYPIDWFFNFPRITKIGFYCIAILSILCSATSQVNATEIRWSGFMSAIAGRTLQSGGRYNTGYTGYNNGIYADTLTYEQESIAGLQAQALINENTRATVQLVARAGDYNSITAEWAYLTFAFSNAVELNMGRFRLPAYRFSEYFEVGKAYYWIRPPAEIYVNPNGIYGAKLVYNSSLGRYDIRIQAWNGSGYADLPDQAQVKFRNNSGIRLSFSGESWSVETVYNETDTDIILNPNLTVETSLSIWGAAYIASWDALLLRAEYTVLSQPVFPDAKAWYASVGYKLRRLTPHLTFTDSDQYIDIPESETITLGLRWELNPNADFKLEYLERDLAAPGADNVSLIAFGIDLSF